LSHDRSKAHHNSIHKTTFSDIMTKLTKVADLELESES